MKLLEVKGLTKSIGKNRIVEDLSFDVDKGEIVGFLGPNGSGKTTTIRLITGMIRKDSGSMLINGTDRDRDPVGAMKYIGSVVESPDPYLYLSGLENLRQVARIRKLPQSEIDRVVAITGLSGRIKDKVRKYSLGMKQRLGVATALLGSPELLLLDEPTNGLDPDGMRQFRELLKSIADSGVSVFLSSHILSEVEQLCDRVIFLEKGRIQAIESIEKIHSRGLYHLETPKSALTEEILRSIALLQVIKETETGYLLDLNGEESEVLRAIVLAGIPTRSFAPQLKDLEERYLEVVKGGVR